MKRTVEQKNVGKRSGRRERARGANNDPEEKHANIFRKRPAISSSILHHIRECWSRRFFESPGVLRGFREGFGRRCRISGGVVARAKRTLPSPFASRANLQLPAVRDLEEFIPCRVPLHLLNCELVFRHASSLDPLPGAHFSSSRPSRGYLHSSLLVAARLRCSGGADASPTRLSTRTLHRQNTHTNNTNSRRCQWDAEQLAKRSGTPSLHLTLAQRCSRL